VTTPCRVSLVPTPVDFRSVLVIVASSFGDCREAVTVEVPVDLAAACTGDVPEDLVVVLPWLDLVTEDPAVFAPEDFLLVDFDPMDFALSWLLIPRQRWWASFEEASAWGLDLEVEFWWRQAGQSTPKTWLAGGSGGG
jgi:hypothetical protein